MLSPSVLRELRSVWLPNVSDAGLARLIDLLEKGSPLLLNGRFTAAIPTGCLATHIGWHHPDVCHRTEDAGILWLTRIAQLNPATSHVIREWDSRDPRDWGFRVDLLAEFAGEQSRRRDEPAPATVQPVLASV